MIDLCDACERFADELEKELASLHLKGKAGVWKSAKVAFKVDRRQNELRAYEKRITSLRAEMNTQLLRLLGKNGSQPVARRVYLLMTQKGDKQATAAKSLIQLQRRDIDLQASITSDMEQLRTNIVKDLQTLRSEQISTHDVLLQLQQLIACARDNDAKLSLLDSLCYEGMNTRHEAISDTYTDTYEWVFTVDDDRCCTAHLHDWLKKGNGVFWVSGKPGSGKSTFMKFVHGHLRTHELLEYWAQQRNGELIVAAHYFTVNGDPVQRSQAGLLRAIAAGLVRQCPGIFADLWHEEDFVSGHTCSGRRLHDTEWSVSTLRKMLQKVRDTPLERKGRSLCYVFFIDGLDEYDGNHEELTEVIQQITNSGSIKICASSRPWNVFERALGGNDDRKLYMHDLTHEDISTFVKDHIGTDVHFLALLKEDSDAQDIIDSIISRAQGVFLWVYLVERQVHRSLINQDELETLLRRVAQFPSDLEDYFRFMFDNLVRMLFKTKFACKAC